MLVTRAYVGKLVTTFLSLTKTNDHRAFHNTNTNTNSDNNSNSVNNKCVKQEYKYHLPPPGVTYDTNPTVFGRILEGSLPALTLLENEELVSIGDKYPKAPFHALIIPKKYIESIHALDASADDCHLYLLTNMKDMAMATLQIEQPAAYNNHDYLLCFHVPPFISVKHLHLHVLAPASEMQIQYRWGKFLVGSFWCTDVDEIINQLKSK